MELQKTKHEIKLAQWRELVQACRGSGMHIKDWCAEQGINMKTYYRWQQLVWDAGIQGIKHKSSAATFAEYRTEQPALPATELPTSTAVVLHLSCGRVEIQNGADRETLEATLFALQRIC